MRDASGGVLNTERPRAGGALEEQPAADGVLGACRDAPFRRRWRLRLPTSCTHGPRDDRFERRLGGHVRARSDGESAHRSVPDASLGASSTSVWFQPPSWPSTTPTASWSRTVPIGAVRTSSGSMRRSCGLGSAPSDRSEGRKSQVCFERETPTILTFDVRRPANRVRLDGAGQSIRPRRSRGRRSREPSGSRRRLTTTPSSRVGSVSFRVVTNTPRTDRSPARRRSTPRATTAVAPSTRPIEFTTGDPVPTVRSEEPHRSEPYSVLLTGPDDGVSVLLSIINSGTHPRSCPTLRRGDRW
jgi:hypothetical protein